MACRSGLVERSACRIVTAKEKIDRLEASIQSQSDQLKMAFHQKIDAQLASENITDARELTCGSHVKTEYASEFDLAKITIVVTSALKGAMAVKDPQVESPAIDQRAIAACTDAVNCVAEAAKSSLQSSASLSFSMTRLSPGLYAFLSASSVNIKDENVFGDEAVTTTAIFYRFMQSINDLKNKAEAGGAMIDARNLLTMKTLQAALTEQLAEHMINIDTWTRKSAAYSAAIKAIEDRLHAHGAQRSAFNAILQHPIKGNDFY